MSQACSGGSGGAPRWSAAARKMANGLHLAATPTFATMALLTGVLGSADVLCSTAGASPLGGMVPMYLLMSAFHLAPWLKLIAAARQYRRPAQAGRETHVQRFRSVRGPPCCFIEGERT